VSDDSTPRYGDSNLDDFGPSLKNYLAGDRNALDGLPPREREIAEQLAPFLEAASRSRLNETPLSAVPDSAPPRAQDPIAAALGLVAGPDDVLGAARFKNSRAHSGLDIKDVADRLSARGWNVDVAQVFRWQRGDTTMTPALLTALADILATSPDSLRPHPAGRKAPRVADLLDDAVIAAFVREWAQQTDRAPSDVRAEASRTLVSLNYRNESSASRDGVLAVLRALRSLDPRWSR
jgi:transcriptional regulator with XRE-family HTH domain